MQQIVDWLKKLGMSEMLSATSSSVRYSPSICVPAAWFQQQSQRFCDIRPSWIASQRASERAPRAEINTLAMAGSPTQIVFPICGAVHTCT